MLSRMIRWVSFAVNKKENERRSSRNLSGVNEKGSGPRCCRTRQEMFYSMLMRECQRSHSVSRGRRSFARSFTMAGSLKRR
jgi:hypothetical protein